METWIWILIGLVALVIVLGLWGIQRGRGRRSARLRESVAARPAPPVPAAPTEDLVAKALRQREEELAQRPRTVELEVTPAPVERQAAPPNPLKVRLDEPPMEIETPQQETGVSKVQRMAEEQWEGIHVVGPAAKTRPTAASTKKESDDFEAPARSKKESTDPALGWDDVEIKKDRR